MLRDNVLPREERVGCSQTLAGQAKPCNLGSTVTALFWHWPLARSRRERPTGAERTDAFRGMPLNKTMAPNSLSTEVLNFDHRDRIEYLHRIVVQCVGNQRDGPQQRTYIYAFIKGLLKPPSF